MLPMKDGSYVVAEFVEDIKNAKSGYSYIVVTKDDGMTYKRLDNLIEEKQSFLFEARQLKLPSLRSTCY